MSCNRLRLSSWMSRERLQISQIMLFIFKLFLISSFSILLGSIFYLLLFTLYLILIFQRRLDCLCYFFIICLCNSVLMFTDHWASSSKAGCLDLQYQICFQFLKLTSEQLTQKELSILEKSSKLIEKITENINKDTSTTQDSLDSPNDQEDNFLTQRPKLTLSRSRSNATLRRSQNGITEAFLEVQKLCSEKTVTTISSLVCEGKKAREKILVLDRLERELKKNQSKTQASQAQLLLLRKKNQDLSVKNRSLEQEVSLLRDKIKEAKQQLEITSKGWGGVSKQPEQVHYDKLKKYLEDRELQMTRKERQLRAIHEKIQLAIESTVEGGCERCCQMVRKIKDSVVTYRRFLEEEASLAETLYLNYKTLFS